MTDRPTEQEEAAALARRICAQAVGVNRISGDTMIREPEVIRIAREALAAARADERERALEEAGRDLADRAKGLRNTAAMNVRNALEGERLGVLNGGRETAQRLQEQAIGISIARDAIRFLAREGKR